MRLTQEQYNKLRGAGLSEDKIKALAQQNGYELPTPNTTDTSSSNVVTSNIRNEQPTKSLTQGQVQDLRDAGLSDEKIYALAQQNGYSVPEQTGFIKSLVQGVAKAPLRLVSTLRAIPNIIRAKTAQEEELAKTKNYDYGFLGTAKPLQSPIDAAATGLELGSYAIGGGGAKNVVGSAVKQGLKSSVIKSGISGLKYGASGGALMSFGQGLQEPNKDNLITDTLLGTAIGGATGLTFGLATPIVAKIGGTVKRFTNLNEINNELVKLNGEALRPKASQLEKWSVTGKDPIKTYTEIFGADIPKVGKDNRFTKESIDDFVNRVDSVYRPAAEKFNEILRASPNVNAFNDVESLAIKYLDRYNLPAEMQDKAIQNIRTKLQAEKNLALKRGLLLGDDSVPVYYTDNLKDKYWGVTKNFGTEDATIANAVNGSIGHGMKDSIEKSITDLNVKQFNKNLGDLIVLKDYLSSKAGALAGTGGKVTRLASRLAGAVAGSGGGPIGSIVGSLTGDKLAQILIDPAMQPYRWLINKRLQRLPQAEIMRLQQEADDVLKTMFNKRNEILKLPPPQYYDNVAGVITPTIKNQTNPIIAGGETTFEPMARKINNPDVQPQIKSDNIPPMTTPTNIDKNIKPIIPQNNNQIYGGVAGIEISKDENGKTTVKFNPEKAIAGVIGMTAFKKLSPKVLADAKIKLTDDLENAVLKELNIIDTLPVVANNKLNMGSDVLFRIMQLKDKMERKPLSRAEILEAIPLLKSQGIDVISNTVGLGNTNKLKINSTKK